MSSKSVDVDQNPKDNHLYLLLHDKESRLLKSHIYPSFWKRSLFKDFSKSEMALKGSLYEKIDCKKKDNDLYMSSVKNSQRIIQCTLKEVYQLSKKQSDLLLAISSDNARYDFFKDKEQLEYACNAKCGDPVSADIKGVLCEGRLMYIGEIGKKKGIHFGVELKEPVGNCDGYFEKCRYFTCEQKHGIFLSANDIFFLPTEESLGKDKKAVDRSNSVSNEKSAAKENSFKKDTDLQYGTRVMYFDRVEPIAGTVRHLERKKGGGEIAGVELDKAIKDGRDGSYDGEKHFECVKGKGIWVKPETLIREDDYKGNSKDASDSKSYVFIDDSGGEGESAKLLKRECKSLEKEPFDPQLQQKEMLKIYEASSKCSKENQLPSKSNIDTIEDEKGRDDALNAIDKNINKIKNDIGLETSGIRNGINSYDKKSYEKFKEMGHLSSNSLNDNQKKVYTHHISEGENKRGTYKVSLERNTDWRSNMYASQRKPTENMNNNFSSSILAEVGSNKEEHTLNDSRYDMIYNGSVSNGDKDYSSSLQIGSMVEVNINGDYHYGVLKWKGYDISCSEEMAGLEIEYPVNLPCFTDGTFQGRRYFFSSTGRAFFIKLRNCKPDSRFEHSSMPVMIEDNTKCVEGFVLPSTRLEKEFLGRNKGIQGHHNSCYMDATLFAMFAYSQEFDVILNRKRRNNDIECYDEVQKILKEKIVNPLRKYGDVNQKSVYELRKCLNKLASIGGFLTEEKDPEEFIVLLLEKVLKVDPFIKLSFGNDRKEVSHLYQIFTDKDERNPLPSVQYLLEYSFLTSHLQLAELPSVMILQMPRFGHQKLYKRIQINSHIDIAPLLSDVLHPCVVCGHPAACYCEDCSCLFGWEIVYTYLCEQCYHSVHKHPKREGTHKRPVMLKPLQSITSPRSSQQPLLMELFAVVCIEKSHYVSFVKCGLDDDENWLFFDSMADRVGGENGFNIPEVTQMEDLKRFLNGKPLQISELDKKENEQLLRFYEDSSLCFYRNRRLSMYR